LIRLEYWKNNAFRFLVLSILARKYLVIPATSAAIGKVFSITRNIITKNRNKLSPETVKELVLLKSWKIKDLNELKVKNTEIKE
jgi:hypothetical protein